MRQNHLGAGRHDGERAEDAALLRAVTEASNPVVVLDRIVAQALVLVPGADGATVELVDGDDLVYVASGGTLTDHIGVRLSIDGSLSGLSVRSNEVVCADDTESDPRVNREACRAVGAASMVCVPLVGHSRPVGVLKVASGRTHAFGGNDMALLERLAPFITALVASASDLSDIVPGLIDRVRTEGTDGRSREPGEHVLATNQASAVSQFVANVMSPGIVDDVAAHDRIERALGPEGLAMVLQPIYRLDRRTLFGAEALARFRVPPSRPPDRWFAEAHRVGRGVELELRAVGAALELLPQIPTGVHLAVNTGPHTAVDARLARLLDAVDGRRIVLELTEHAEIDDYPTLERVLCRYRRAGIRIAVDDAGAGVSGLTHILRVAPDFIKLDRELTVGIELDPVRRSLASALAVFASESGSQVIAEGIETADALAVLTDLGISYGQGFYLGMPQDVRELRPRPSELRRIHFPAVRSRG